MMSDKDNNLLKSDILTVGSELSEKLNAIGVPNTFGKASEGKDNLMSIIRMTINGIDMILKDYYNKSEVNTLLNGKSDTSHNHDSVYAKIDQIREILKDYYNKSEVNTLLNGKSDTSHKHDSVYANKNHNHNAVYANKNHNHDSAYASKNHNHDTAYASKSHQHNGADVILSNSNDVDTEIGTIEDDITSINGDITSLNNSITNNTQLHQTKITMNGNFHFVNPTSYTLYRVGHIVIAHLWSAQCKPATAGWVNIANIPNGYKPIADVFGGVTTTGQSYITQVSTVDKNKIRGYVDSTPSKNMWWGFHFIWVTNDDYPS